MSLVACIVMVPASVFGQNKKGNGKLVKSTVPVIKTSNDSISYALGLSMVEGLPPYLSQMGILVDTAAVNKDYTARIKAEADVAAKAKLEKEFGAKMDSAKIANAKNLNQFIGGFNQAINATADEAAFNAGVSIAGQLSLMMKNAATQILGEEDNLNRDAFVYAFVSKLKNEAPLLDIADPQAMIQQKMDAEKTAKEAAETEALKAQYADKIAEGRAFFDANKAKPNVVSLPSGLQYVIEQKGNGVVPKINEKVTVHYKGTLLDGTVFDSSYDRGEPTEFSVGQLIKGFNEALMIMPEGSKWTIYIPYDLAYGAIDRGLIKPFSDLIFEIELIKVGEEPESAE